jgi:hypothetical protein
MDLSLKVGGLSVRAGKKLRTYKTRPRYSCKLVKDQPSILLGSTSRSHGEGAGSTSDLLRSTGDPLIVQGLKTSGRSFEASAAVG